MSSWAVTDSTGLTWVRATQARAITQALILVPALVAIIAQQFAAPTAQMWPAPFVFALAALTARSPDSVRGSFFITAYAVWWLLVETDETTLWALVAALCLLAFHSAVAFAAAGPHGQVADAASARRWLRDTGLVAMATWGVWLLVAGLHGATQSSEVLLGICLLLVAALVMLATGPASPPPPTPPTSGPDRAQDSATG